MCVLMLPAEHKADAREHQDRQDDAVKTAVIDPAVDPGAQMRTKYCGGRDEQRAFEKFPTDQTGDRRRASIMNRIARMNT